MKLRLAMFLIVCLAVASCKSPVTPPPPPTEYTLTVAVSPSGGGTVAQSPSRSSIPSGWVATLTATAASGYSFGSWSGDASGATSPIQVTMDANKSVTAVFIAQYTLTVAVSPSGGGSVAKSPDQTQYAAGTVVTLTATPAAGYTFSQWQGDATGSTNPTTVTMNANRTVTAVFTPVAQYTLTVAASPPGGGTVALSPSGGTYASGTVVTLTATAASGYSFGSWSGDASGATNPATVTMNANKSVTANFALVWTIVVTQPTAGLTWYHRISYNILWTTTMNPAGLVKIELLKAGVVAVTITPSTANNGSYSWTVLNTLANGTNYQIKITSTTSSSISGTSPNFSIMKPTITVTQPAAGVAWSRGKPYNIIWTSPVLGSGTVKIDLYRGTVLNSTIISTTPNDGTHSWTISKLLTLANNYSVRITWLTDTSVFGTSGVFTIKR